MSKKNKYLLLGLGLTTLAAAAFSPLVYYELKAQKHITSKEYKKAGDTYKNLSFLSSTYAERAALCYYDDFIKKYKNLYFQRATLIFVTSPLTKKDRKTGKTLLTIDNEKSTAYKIKEIFKAVTDLNENQHKTTKQEQESFNAENNNAIQNILNLIATTKLKDKKYLQESIKVIELERYSKQIIHCANENQFKNASIFLEILIDKYNTLYTSSPTPVTKSLMQHAVANTYFHYKKPFLANKKQQSFSNKILEYLQVIKEQNTELIKENGQKFSAQHVILLKNNEQLNDLYSKLIHAYQHEYNEFQHFHKKLTHHFDQFCDTLRKKHSKINSNFSKINDIYSIIRHDDLKSNIQAEQLANLAQKYLNNKDKPLDNIAAFFSIHYHHIYSLQQAKEGNPLIAKKHLNSAAQIYQQHKTSNQSSFNTYYTSFCNLMNEELLYRFEQNPQKKYLKEMADSLLKRTK